MRGIHWALLKIATLRGVWCYIIESHIPTLDLWGSMSTTAYEPGPCCGRSVHKATPTLVANITMSSSFN